MRPPCNHSVLSTATRGANLPQIVPHVILTMGDSHMKAEILAQVKMN